MTIILQTVISDLILGRMKILINLRQNYNNKYAHTNNALNENLFFVHNLIESFHLLSETILWAIFYYGAVNIVKAIIHLKYNAGFTLYIFYFFSS